jgi:tetratricopeptide (TPR) repeat protein
VTTPDGLRGRPTPLGVVTPARWQRIEELFDSTLAAPEDERRAHLEQACAGDDDLRAEVESLLASATDAARSLRTVVEGAAGRLAAEATTAQLGRRLGAYRLETLLGEGGMGAVYLATRDDAEYDRRVAIKILRQGLPAADAVARFRDERQILAALDHPGIVRLLDGGSTDEGLPYLVMEHIEGIPIVRHARDHQLSIRARLELFGSVCAAVAYAHQQLVVHRDLKPSNMLVTADGVPKLLDFGIAKLLAGGGTRTAATRTGMGLFTPEYASPEQVRGEPVTTATDVYSLGAVLYELLADRSPYAATGSAHELFRIVCEVEPPRPSAIAPTDRRSALGGDLDNIVLKALHKDPARRYRSVEQLAQDVRRHLDGLPVVARAATPGYRARKFVRRHRGKLVLTTLVAAALATSTIYSIREARRADLEAARAQRRFADVRQLATSLLVELDGKIRDLKGSTPAREWIVSRALAYLDMLAAEDSDDPELGRELARAYMRIGDIQGSSYEPNLGRAKDGVRSYDKARAILARLAAAGHDDPASRELGIAGDYGLGFVLQSAGELSVARDHLRAARAAGELEPTPANRVLAMRGCTGLAVIDTWLGDLDVARVDTTACVDAARRWSATDPGPDPAYWIGVTLTVRLDVEIQLADPEAAVSDGRAALAALEQLAARYPDDARYTREVSYIGARLAQATGGIGDSDLWTPNLGDLDTAERLLERSSELAAKVAARDPMDLRSTLEVASHRANLATAIGERDPAAAIARFEVVNASFTALPGEQRGEFYARQIEWLPHCAMSVALARLGRRTEALDQAERGLAIVQHRSAADARLDDFRVACAYQVALARHLLGDDAIAADLLDRLARDLEVRRLAHPTITNLMGEVATLSLRADLGGADACRDRTHALAVWRSWTRAPTAFLRRREAELVRAAAGCP